MWSLAIVVFKTAAQSALVEFLAGKFKKALTYITTTHKHVKKKAKHVFKKKK